MIDADVSAEENDATGDLVFNAAGVYCVCCFARLRRCYGIDG